MIVGRIECRDCYRYYPLSFRFSIGLTATRPAMTECDHLLWPCSRQKPVSERRAGIIQDLRRLKSLLSSA